MVDRASSPTCAGSPSATRSTSPTATPARCRAASTPAATTATSRDSDHYNGLAVDIVPLEASDRNATPTGAAISRLALWAEPVQSLPAPPFRWVGYDGDAGHGCGHHLHLSWNHAPAARVRARRMGRSLPGRRQRNGRRAAPASARRAPKPPPGPSGGISQLPHRRHRGPRPRLTPAGGPASIGCGADACLDRRRLCPAARSASPAAAAARTTRPRSPAWKGPAPIWEPWRRRRATSNWTARRRSATAWPRTSSGGDLATVGEAMIEAATELNAEARAAAGERREPAARLPDRGRRARRRARPKASTPTWSAASSSRPATPPAANPSPRPSSPPTSAASTPATPTASCKTQPRCSARQAEFRAACEQGRRAVCASYRSPASRVAPRCAEQSRGRSLRRPSRRASCG